jgi:hypothetical protein
MDDWGDRFYTRDAVNFFLAQRKNPNGCAPKMTWFTSLSYTNYSMVTDVSPPPRVFLPWTVTDRSVQWYVSGNEIADHTMVSSVPSNSRDCTDEELRRMWELLPRMRSSGT